MPTPAGPNIGSQRGHRYGARPEIGVDPVSEYLTVTFPVAIIDASGPALFFTWFVDPSLPRRSSLPMRAPFLRVLSPLTAAVVLAGVLTTPLRAQDAAPAPNRAEGEGPFDRLIIRGATLIDGTGAPPRGPGRHRRRAESHHPHCRRGIPRCSRSMSVAAHRDRRARSRPRGCTSCRGSSTCTSTPAASPRRRNPNTSTSCGWGTG